MVLLVLTAAAVVLAAAVPPSPALIPARDSVGFVSIVLDEGVELIRTSTRRPVLLAWTSEEQARAVEGKIREAWEWLISTIQADWQASVAGCASCPPPALDEACVEAARQAVLARIRTTYQPEYWRRVEEALRSIPTVWWQSPRPGQGAVLAAVFAPASPDLRSLLPDPYYWQAPRTGRTPPDPLAEPPGDPAMEAAKEARLSGVLARVADYQRIGYVVFMRTTGKFTPRTFYAVVSVCCLVCTGSGEDRRCEMQCGAWTVALTAVLEQAVVDWPAVAEGYGIPGVK